MANENKEIGDIVKKCKILLLDIEGTTTSISFVKDKLFTYAEEKVKDFLDSQWENADVKEAVAALRKLAIEDKEGDVDGVVAIPGEDASKDDQIAGLVSSVKWQMGADRKAGPLKQLQGLIWKQGYDNGDIKGHVYDDVSSAIEAWHSAEGQKVYIYSSGSVQAQKLLFGMSQAGDLLKFIDGHFDTAVGAKQEAASYKNIAEKIDCKPEEILFLTDIVKEAEAARSAGLHAALVSREGNAPLPTEATASFPVLHSLADLTVSNKRKTDPQEEETPAAKVQKTDVIEDVKTALETVSSEAAPKETVEPEKMDVEETVTSAEVTKEVPVVKEQVIVEEVTDSNGASSITSVIDIEPMVEDVDEKENKTEKKEAEKVAEEDKKEVESKVAVETPSIVTEIEEITEDKPLPDVAVDIEPVIEEPDNGEEMEELKNVGDVLEKECDEILSKVNNVTNLENIAAKPMLKTIAEETMETDNTDSNDIANRILDTEIDLEMKQSDDDIDLNTVSEMTDEEKTEDKVLEEKESKESSPMENKTEKTVTENKDEKVPEKMDVENKKKENPEEKSTENSAEKVVESSPAETKPQETKETKMEEEQKSEKENKDSPAVEITSTETVTAVETKDSNAVEEKKAEEKQSEPTPSEEVKPAEVESVAQETKTEEAKPVTDEVKVAETTPQESSKDDEPQLNGKATNGDGETVTNGDANKDEELSARLSEDKTVENGKVNGSNGDSSADKAQGDCKMEEIKVKTVAAEEPQTDPIEQPTEA